MSIGSCQHFQRRRIWLGFRRFRKIGKPVSWLRHESPSVPMGQLGSHLMNFREIPHFSIFRKSVNRVHIPIKSNNNNRYCTWSPIYIFRSYLPQFSLESEMFQTKVVEKIKTHILYSVTFSRKSYRLWDNVGKIL
jgi:hypothetical protein